MTARILIAEDELPMRRGIAILLQAKGYEVLEAANGNEALVKAHAARPDLLVLDVLHVLARAEGRVVARDDLLDAVWGGDAVNPRTLDNVMVKLRQALEPEPERPTYLLTVRGRGYRLAIEGAREV